MNAAVNLPRLSLFLMFASFSLTPNAASFFNSCACITRHLFNSTLSKFAVILPRVASNLTRVYARPSACFAVEGRVIRHAALQMPRITCCQSGRTRERASRNPGAANTVPAAPGFPLFALRASAGMTGMAGAFRPSAMTIGSSSACAHCTVGTVGGRVFCNAAERSAQLLRDALI